MTDIIGDNRPNRLKGKLKNDYLVGLEGNDYLLGLGGNDRLDGNEGNDLLDGGGGADTLIGGQDNDTYIIDNVGDRIFEQSYEGRDLVKSAISLALGDALEDLQLLGEQSLIGVGNSLNNRLTGNSSKNILIGESGNDILFSLDGNDVLIGDGKADKPFAGKIGNDRMVGGTGDDIYYVNSKGDQVIELNEQGNDAVFSNLSRYTLPANVEQLDLSDTARNINGRGNELDNSLFGNRGNNLLEGQSGDDTLNGGLGRDRLIGGLGNDRYLVDNIGDIIVEAETQGVDTVFSSVDYTLAVNVEQLYLQGSSNISGVGNQLDNMLVGNTGANVLSGALGNDSLIGKQGNDTLTGGGGTDLFLFDMPNNQPFLAAEIGIDTITDFRSDHNFVVLSKSTFALQSNASTQGAIGFSTFNEFGSVANDAAAATSSARIIFSEATGTLFYNSNGTITGFGASSTSGAFAVFQGVSSLNFLDFIIVT